jgi:C-terminal processing protease CtpA/Prc
MNLNWNVVKLVVPSLMSFVVSSQIAKAYQDPTKTTTAQSNTVTVVTSDDENAVKQTRDDVLQKLKKSLKNLKLEDADREKVLEEVKKILPSILEETGLRTGPQGLRSMFRTRLVSPLNTRNDVYRIGISLHQSTSAEEPDDSDDDNDVDDLSTTKTEASKRGLLVEETMADSPAQKAGIAKGDIVVSVDGKQVEELSDLMTKIQSAGKEAKSIQLQLDRDGKSITVEVKPIKMESADLSMESIELAMPPSGFVFDTEGVKSFQDASKKWSFRVPQSSGVVVQSQSDAGDSGELRKEVSQLKTEILELKKLVKKLIDKK